MSEYFYFGGFEIPAAAALAVGLALLMFGRWLYWVFIAVGGFALGYWAGMEFLLDVPEKMVLVVAAAAGLLAAVLAVAVQKVAVAAVGFLAGGLVVVRATTSLGYEPGLWVWVVAAAAGVVGVFLARTLFNLALIVLTSLAGAALVSQPIDWLPPQAHVLFLLLAASGVMFQLLIGRQR